MIHVTNEVDVIDIRAKELLDKWSDSLEKYKVIDGVLDRIVEVMREIRSSLDALLPQLSEDDQMEILNYIDASVVELKVEASRLF